MNKSTALIAIAAFAALASTAVRAESPAADHAVRACIDGSRTRAEVMAEAATVAKTRSTEPAGSRVAAPVKSTLDTATVRAQAAQALRLGQIPSGELSL
jgi:glycerate kinase